MWINLSELLSFRLEGERCPHLLDFQKTPLGLWRCVCIDTQMIDVCRMSTTYTDHHGAYLITPDFPFSYTPGRHCSCTLHAVAADGQLAVEFVHVRLRQYEPDTCHDWIDVQVTRDSHLHVT